MKDNAVTNQGAERFPNQFPDKKMSKVLLAYTVKGLITSLKTRLLQSQKG